MINFGSVYEWKWKFWCWGRNNQDNWVHAMVTMIFIRYGRCIFTFPREGFQLHAPSQCNETMQHEIWKYSYLRRRYFCDQHRLFNSKLHQSTKNYSTPAGRCEVNGWYFHNTFSGRELGHDFNTLKPGNNGRHFADDIFQFIFFVCKMFVIFVQILLQFVPKSSIMKWLR